jgi:hypothetical protein
MRGDYKFWISVGIALLIYLSLTFYQVRCVVYGIAILFFGIGAVMSFIYWVDKKGWDDRFDNPRDIEEKVLMYSNPIYWLLRLVTLFNKFLRNNF